MVHFGGGRRRGLRGGDLLDVGVRLPAFFTEGLVEGAAQLREESHKEHVRDLTGEKKAIYQSACVEPHLSDRRGFFFSGPFAVGGRAGFQIKSRLRINKSIEMVTAHV